MCQTAPLGRAGGWRKLVGENLPASRLSSQEYVTTVTDPEFKLAPFKERKRKRSFYQLRLNKLRQTQQVNPLPKWINKGSLRKELNPTSLMLLDLPPAPVGWSSSCIQDECLEARLQATGKLAVLSLKCGHVQDTSRRGGREKEYCENRQSCLWFQWRKLKAHCDCVFLLR